MSTYLFLNNTGGDLTTLILIAVLVFLAIIPVLIGASALARISHLSGLIIAALNHLEFRIAKIEGCQIENLPIIRELIKDEHYPKLIETFQEFEDDSNKLFHAKWTTDLRQYINREHLLSQSQYNLLAANWAYRILCFGLFTSSFALLFTFTLGGEGIKFVQPFTLLPALSGTIFFFLVYYRSARARNDMDMAMKKMAESTALRLPVFSEMAGAAVLIDAFMQYDRKMEASVNQLSNSISGLLNKEMVAAVATSIEATLNASLVPTLNASHLTLQNLASDISERQSQGMESLAEHFTQNVSDILARRLDGFFREVDTYLEQLKNTKGELNQSLTLLNSYRETSMNLDASIAQSIESQNQQNVRNDAFLEQLSQALVNLSATSQQLYELQSGNSRSLEAALAELTNQMNGFVAKVDHLSQTIEAEHQASQEGYRLLMSSQSQVMKNYQSLSLEIVNGSENLQQQSKLLAEQVRSLNANLCESVQDFNVALTKGVNQVLLDVDHNLTDITKRLAVTAQEIRDLNNQNLKNNGSHASNSEA